MTTTTTKTKPRSALALSLPLLLALVGAGCPAGSTDDTLEGARAPTRTAPPSAAASAAASTAPPATRPVSGAVVAADLCPDHGVLEALCTKHHPSLAAVFQAKGDWCVEHGFPESICPLCHPERGGRPAASLDVVDDGAPADGTRVTLKSRELAEQAGIATTPARVSPRGPSVTATARVVYDASKVALVNARAPGVVRELRVDVGSRVKKGQALAVIDSAAVGADRSNLMAARARLLSAEATASREAELVQKGISAQKDLQQAEHERAAARAAVAAAEAAVGVVGVVGSGGPGGSGGGDAGQYTLTAPLAGVVVERNVAVGQTVSSEPMLLQIVDASSLWAEIDVPERDLAVVATGQSIELVVDALPARRFTGTIHYIAPGIDPATRTAQARVALDNADGALRAHMFGTARIAVGGDRAAVLVPAEAVQRVKSVALVFVKIGDGRYEARRVTLGLDEPAPVRANAIESGAESSVDLVEVRTGVVAGEEVVTTGSFLLKTETLKGAIGAGCCD